MSLALRPVERVIEALGKLGIEVSKEVLVRSSLGAADIDEGLRLLQHLHDVVVAGEYETLAATVVVNRVPGTKCPVDSVGIVAL